MAKKPENQFITSVHKHIPISHLYRMKNNNPFVGGIPDVYYSGSLSDLWIEYKFITATTPRNTVVPSLSKQQLAWIKGRQSEGRSVWVVIGCKNGGVILKDTGEMEHGITPLEFLERVITRKQLIETIYKYCTGEKYGTTGN